MERGRVAAQRRAEKNRDWCREGFACQGQSTRRPGFIIFLHYASATQNAEHTHTHPHTHTHTHTLNVMMEDYLMSDTLTCAGVGLQSVPSATHTPVAPR